MSARLLRMQRRLRLATPCRSALSRLPRRLLSTGVPCSFGARDGTSITNKHTVLDQVDAALGLARPADIELLLADHLSCVDSTLQRALHGTILRYGHVAVKYTTSDGTQRVMNILGTLDAPGAQRHPCTHTHTHSHARARARACTRTRTRTRTHALTHTHTHTLTRMHTLAGSRMVNFVPPSEYLYGTAGFDTFSQQGGAYNRNVVGVRIERVAPGATDAMHAYFLALDARSLVGGSSGSADPSRRGAARFQLVEAPPIACLSVYTGLFAQPSMSLSSHLSTCLPVYAYHPPAYAATHLMIYDLSGSALLRCRAHAVATRQAPPPRPRSAPRLHPRPRTRPRRHRRLAGRLSTRLCEHGAGTRG